MRTDAGQFAVHELVPRPRLAERSDAVLTLERAAAAAGVALAEPVPDPTTGRAGAELGGHLVTVHRWVEAEPVHVDRSPPALYRALGGSVARVHGLGLRADSLPGDTLDVRPSAAEWRDLADAADERGLPWAAGLRDAAADLAAAIDILDGWDRDAGEAPVLGHRDLTSQNVLDLDGTPVLIDWEDAGPIAPGAELGRTALDNLGRDGVLDALVLRQLLASYAEVAPLPPIGPHWCSLWIRGLVVFADHCARSCLAGAADASLVRLQSEVVERTPEELRRRLAAVPGYVAAFDQASRSSS